MKVSTELFIEGFESFYEAFYAWKILLFMDNHDKHLNSVKNYFFDWINTPWQ